MMIKMQRLGNKSEDKGGKPQPRLVNRGKNDINHIEPRGIRKMCKDKVIKWCCAPYIISDDPLNLQNFKFQKNKNG